jgi:hypothetical protein
MAVGLLTVVKVALLSSSKVYRCPALNQRVQGSSPCAPATAFSSY